MKKVFLMLAVFSFGVVVAQDLKDINITPKNSWFKAGINATIPVSDAADLSFFSMGVDVRAQYLFTSHFGIGVASGYSHYFAKDNFDDFGVIPLAGFARYYFQKEGVFVGVDLGYGFLSNVDDSGGTYFNPQIGYHNDNWNIYGFYQNTFAENVVIRAVGVGATYNIKF